MSDNDNRIPFVLDLDDSNFKKGFDAARGNLGDFIGDLKKIAPTAALIGTAYLGIRAAVGSVFRAEEVKSLTRQYDILAERAGLSGAVLRDAMTRASEGVISNTDLLKAGSKAMLQFGEDAGRLPEVMALATKAAAAGNESVLDTFQAISQAMATGQTKALKQFGIIIDSEKAYRDYAASIGVAANSLSEAGKRQAVLNEALRQGREQFGSLDTDVDKASDAWDRFKNVVSGTIDSIAMIIERGIGPMVARSFEKMANSLSRLKDNLDATFGTGGDQAMAQVRLLEGDIKKLEDQIRGYGEKNQGFIEGVYRFGEAGLPFVDQAKQKLASLREELAKTQAQLAPKGGATGTAEDPQDAQKRIENEAKFQKDMARLRQERLVIEQANAMSVAQVDALRAEQKVLLAQSTEARIAEIQSAAYLTEQQKRDELAIVRQIEAQRAIQLEQDYTDQKIAALQRYQEEAKSTGDGIGRAFEAGAQRAQLQMNQFGAVGQRVFDSFANNATDALLQWGAGQKTAAEAAKGFIFGMLADEAEARGKMLLLASIWPPNPLGIAGGAGLIALAGFLRSQAGGSAGGGGGAGGAGGAGGGVGSGGGGFESSRPSMREEAAPRRAVEIRIEGGYFETEQTRTRLLDMVRDASDADDIIFRSLR
jgi:hypothetical protein